MPAHLIICPACTRHVRVTELACPFCSAAIPDELRATPAPRAAPAGLSRAALVTLAALGGGVTAAACGQTAPESSMNAPMNEPAYGGIGLPAYGATPAPISDAGSDASDAGTPADAGNEADAGDDGSTISPAYGAVAPPGDTD